MLQSGAMDPSLKKELVKDAFGLSAVFIFLATMLLAAFRWSDDPGPVAALGTAPLVLLVAGFILKRCRFYRTVGGRG